MRQAITTKFLGPTNFNGARVKASAQAGSVTIGWDHALNADDNHIAAAQALAHKYDWAGKWVGGAVESGVGYAFVTQDSGTPDFEVIR